MKYHKPPPEAEIMLELNDIVYQQDAHIVYVMDGEGNIFESVEKPIIPNMITPLRVEPVPDSEIDTVNLNVGKGWEYYKDSIF